MSAPNLQVLPWSRPLVVQAVAYLAAGWSGTGPLDLSRTWIVVPTRQSGRRLREDLAAFAAAQGQAVLSPRISLPVGLLDDIVSGRKVAARHDSLLAWTEVLRTIDLSAFDEVFPIEPPARDFVWAFRLAEQLLTLQQTLGEDGLRIGNVTERAGDRLPEARRWSQLARLEQHYDQRLSREDLSDLHAVRLRALETAVPPEGIERVVVIGTPDPPPLVLRLLDRHARSCDVSILVHGPESETPDTLFDRWGRPLQEAWARRSIDWPDFPRQVHLCADAAAQADLVARIAQTYEEPDRCIGLGMEDRELWAPILSVLGRANISTFNPEGRPRRNVSLFHLAGRLAELAREPSFEHAAALVRCPDVLEWLHCRRTGIPPSRLLGLMDELHARHLPVSLASALAHVSDPASRCAELAPVLDLIDSLHKRLTSFPFPEGILEVLAEIFEGRSFENNRPADAERVDAASEFVQTALATGAAAKRYPTVGDADAWELALRLFGESRQAGDKPAEAVELQGWLELPWNDAPHLVIAGFNDGIIPSAISGDAFLPEQLRELLGLKTNHARLARDSYLLHTLVESRRDSGRIDILLGKNSASGDPLRPSRLLLNCSDEELPGRVQFLFRDVPTETSSTPWRRGWKLEPDPSLRIERLAVTGFKIFLACPFRFYLQRGLRMEAVDPFKAELDNLDFGILCHAALEAFGRNEVIRQSDDPTAIRRFFTDALQRRMWSTYGRELTLPLQMQLESALQRLSKLAERQAQLRAEGWIIEAVEKAFVVDFNGFEVSGKIDRIDRHESTGEWRILDYKTSDKPADPCSTHLRNSRGNEDVASLFEPAVWESKEGTSVWTDLQLPLYLHAVASQLPGSITCGYFNLPKATAETAVSLWEDYDDATQEAAMRCAKGVIEAVKAGRFWPPNEPGNWRHDELAVLFHQGMRDSVSWRGVH